jgi:hypothetical protein
MEEQPTEGRSWTRFVAMVFFYAALVALLVLLSRPDARPFTYQIF